MGGSDVTAVLTSCGRFDHLERTLRGFFAVNRAPLARFVLIEDSGDRAVHEVVRAIDPGIEVMLNATRIGQHAAIDRAYATVTTPLVMHLEDDWAFTRGGFIEAGQAILAACPDVSVVSGRFRDDFGGLPPDLPIERLDGIGFVRVPRKLHPGWFGYALHPGMRRLSEWQRFGPFARYGREWDISYTMKRAGFRMAYLEEGCYREAGRDLSVAGSDPGRPLGLANKLMKSGRKALFAVEAALGRYDD